MLESFMEELLWKYPRDFFPPRYEFKPAARQFTLSDGGRPDISFRDANDRLWVVEVKATAIRTEVADQIYRYVRNLKEAHPHDAIIPAVVAPVINSTVREVFDRWGIEHFEISEATFRRVATERGIEVDPQEPSVDASASGVARATRHPATEKGAAYAEFWGRLLTSFRESYPGETNVKSPQRSNIQGMSIGRSGFETYWVFKDDGRFCVQLSIDSRGARAAEVNKAYFQQLRQSRSEIEKQMGHALEWDESESRDVRRIYSYYPKPATIFDDNEALEGLERWAVEEMKRFRDVFRPRIRGLETAERAPQSTDSHA